ncbi:Uncharacterised protein (plasmid) [Tsukamurella tyrosinosolvens]|uniref:Uncharacterized protein n=1 Tax=Tsukamurella tyrosinosolvens TaxID=57704 RepID=A0A1H4V095_TSUTY|nr:hypothetical protein [Tsukamurella tyrosinosolvens]KXO91087.1 hypothetical protein AXK58_21905 [Tsukamurella tyrosinosolvens]SEC74406.1 hypothetical protein SAMN04489793_3098 [Tsukamurella tyrosinosolvens]VEH90765.1 Uncharacterised protein [Tsukamurella tyrosinosolvens]
MTATDPIACRYPAKTLFADEDAATAGAEAIRAKVEAAGRTYDQLYPYRCPGADHWHLSSKRQGISTCPICHRTGTAAWHTGEVWVISAHEYDWEPCEGQGAVAQNPLLEQARHAVEPEEGFGIGASQSVQSAVDSALDAWEDDIAELVRARRRANAAEREVERLRSELADQRASAPDSLHETTAAKAAPSTHTPEGTAE